MTEDQRRRPIGRNVILLVAFLILVLVGVVTVLMPALDEGTEEEAQPGNEVASETENPAPTP